METVKVLLLLTVLLGAVAWGQPTSANSFIVLLDEIIPRLDRIEARLDAKPKASVTWSVEQDVKESRVVGWTKAGEPIERNVYSGLAWFLFVSTKAGKFRVCEVEKVGQ